MQSFLDVAPDHPFPIRNLPYGAFRRPGFPDPHLGVAIGEFALDLTALEALGRLDLTPLRDTRPFRAATLNPFLALGPDAWRAVRLELQRLLRADEPTLRDDADLRAQVFVTRSRTTPLLPVAIGDYTDFYASKVHAERVGALFRGPDRALRPNWVHLPVGYHGRASSVVVSGTDVFRPCGQRQDDDAPPRYGPTRALDFELEVGAIAGTGNALGSPVPVDRAGAHLFGFVLVNDWSARDIQQWEYVPLGPFQGKSFATSISPWIVPLDALAPFRCDGPAQDPAPLPYLADPQPRAFDVDLEVRLLAADADATTTIARTNARHLYWSFAQMAAHHTANGCNLRPGDLLASGTVSGPDGAGCLLEATRNGADPLRLPDGRRRTYLEDGDRITLTGAAQGDGFRIGFGEVTGRIRPAVCEG